VSDTEHEQDIPLDEPEPEPEPDEDEAAEEESEPEPGLEPEPEADEQALENEDRAKAFKKIDGSFNTYKAAMERNLADEVTDWMFCPLCAAGSVPGFVNKHDLGRVPDQVQANVTMFLGFAREQEYEQDPGTNMCPTCKGRTKVKSGALAGEYIVRGCPNCNGYGFVPPPGTAAVGNGHAPSVAEQVAGNLADLEVPDRDNWNEPRILPDGTINTNHGKMPQYKTVHPVYGVTANLSPEELVTG
jgi:hypothetical protein